MRKPFAFFFAALVPAVLVFAPVPAFAQDKLAEQLRKGVAAEETGQNLDKAIQAYEAVVAQYDAQRKTAGAALFRLAECYRKAGKREQAIAAYSRVVREFGDQASIVDTSRRQLATTFGITEGREARPARASAVVPRELPEAARSSAQTAEANRGLARAKERPPDAVVEGFQLAEARQIEALQQRVEEAKKGVELGTTSRSTLDAIQRELDTAREHFMQQVAERQAAQREAQNQRLLTQQIMKSVEAEILLLQDQIASMEKKAAAGTMSLEDPQLLQLRRDLLGLQRRLYELQSNLRR